MHLRQHGPAAFDGDGDARAGDGRSTIFSKEHAGVDHFAHATVGLLEARDLVGGAVTILHSPQQSQRCVPITLEGERRVTDVLESPRPGHGGFFRHLTDEADRDSARFGYSGQRVRHLHDLRNASSPSIHVCRGDGLNGVDDDERQIRAERVDVSDDIREICFVCEIQVLVVDTYS